ncbi:hypothetical protein INT47_011544 [Mucor saturninus]|uniref:Uncharacterized protein n=1 Tax=Mucor saturninus TaxID=64648 RepID=A0A8H7UZ28_9FUNG|nr:hypothetical protein INT47_011544 [Mucor saturninus]
MEKNLFNELTNIFRSVNEKSDRKALKVKLHNVYEAADPLDSKIIDILINLINKLPGNILINLAVKEFELITNYLDTILSPIFHDPQKILMYRWLNKATESSGNRYPDGGSCIVSQRRISCSTGFCEVKADYMKNNTVDTHLDLLRLCIFGKDTIDNEISNGFSKFTIKVPKSILELPGFIMKLDDIKRLIKAAEDAFNASDAINGRRDIAAMNNIWISLCNAFITRREAANATGNAFFPHWEFHDLMEQATSRMQ